MTNKEKEAIINAIKAVPTEERDKRLRDGARILDDIIAEYPCADRHIRGTVGEGEFLIVDRHSLKPIDEGFLVLTHFYHIEVTQWIGHGTKPKSIDIDLPPCGTRYTEEELLRTVEHLYADIILAGETDSYEEPKK